MPTDPPDSTSPSPSTRLYQTSSDAPKGGGGGILAVILLLLLAGGGAAYYFLIYKPGAAAPLVANPTPGLAPMTATKAAATPDASGNATYTNAQEKQYVQQASDAFVAERQTKLQVFTEAFNTLMTAGGFSAASLTSKDAITARRDLVAKCAAANDDYIAFIKTQEATFKAELQKTPLIPNDVDYVAGDFASKAQTDKVVQLRQAQDESLKTGDAMLDYLDKSFGTWSLNAEKHLVFKKPADSAAFSALAKTYGDQVAALTKQKNEVNANGVDPAAVVAASPGASPPAGNPTSSPAASVTPANSVPTASVTASATPTPAASTAP